MKLMTLNIWGGRVYKPFLKFVKENKDTIDIFCFQEMFQSPESVFSNSIKSNIYFEVEKILKSHKGFFAPTFTGYDTEDHVDFDIAFGQATFVRNTVDILSQETVFVHGSYDNTPPATVDIPNVKVALDLPRNIHVVKIKIEGKEVLIGNLHGYWLPSSKYDSKESMAQMKIVKKIFASFKGPKILVGDFNLRPETKSVKLLEDDMKNLIVEYGVTNTRSSLHKKTEKFADYIMISNEVKVNSFEVINIDVSDHLPLILDFKI